MIWITALAVAIGLAAAAFLIFVDDATEKLVDWFFEKVGLQSGEGPLVVTAEVQAEVVAVTIRNDSKARARLAAVEAKGAGGRSFPIPWSDPAGARAGADEEETRRAFAGRVLPAGESFTFYLDRSELGASPPAELVVLDSSGRSWPVLVHEPKRGSSGAGTSSAAP